MSWIFASLFFVALISWFRLWRRQRKLLVTLRSLSAYTRTRLVGEAVLPPFRCDPDSTARAECLQLAGDIRAMLEEKREREKAVVQGQGFETLLHEIQHGVILVDPGEQVIFANKAIELFFPQNGFRPGRPLLEAVRDDRLVTLVRRVLTTRRRQTEDILLHGTGPAQAGQSHERLLHAEAALLAGNSGSVCLLLVDATERMHIEQIRRDFVANASHEFRTPLAIIHGYIEMLLDGDLSQPAQAERALNVIQKNCLRLSRLVDDMLTISKLENAADLIRAEPFDLAECAREVVEQLKPIITRQQAIVTLQFPPEGCQLSGDRFYWDQILLNLLENALKENPRPGLRAGISAMRLPKSGAWRIKVTDTGVGIPGADVPFVFRRFYRGRKDHSQTVPGTGLGLSIVKRAIEAHGGTISLKSVPGVLTEFIIHLP